MTWLFIYLNSLALRRKMASVIWILSVVLYAEFMCAVSADEFVSLDCQDENHGVYGNDSLLRCFLNSGRKSVRVISATWRRPGEKRPLIMFINDTVREPEDPRFSFKQLQMSGSNIDVSFLVRNTWWTDEGKYECEVVTDSGYAKAVVSLSVTVVLSLDCLDDYRRVYGRNFLSGCFLNSGGKSVMIISATWRRPGAKRPSLMFRNNKFGIPEDPRFFEQLGHVYVAARHLFLDRYTFWKDESKNEFEVAADRLISASTSPLSLTVLLSLDCQDDNHGVHGKESLLRCFLNSGGESVMVISAAWRRPGENRPLITFRNEVSVRGKRRYNKVREPEDPRFSFKQLQMSGSNIDVSFLVRKTLWTDEGKYECQVYTDSGYAIAVVSLSVTATYSKPGMSSVPEKDLQEGMEVTLFCNASGGYPVGMIHWYDQHGTNWTRSAEMTVVETTDKCMNLSSKFTLKASSSAPLYRCLVLNNNGVEEGKAEFDLKFRENEGDQGSMSSTASTASTAVLVIVIPLLCGLLILALRRQRAQRAMYPEGSDMMEEGFLKKGVQAMQRITISSCSTSSAGLNKSKSMEININF